MITSTDMKEIEKKAERLGIEPMLMMENAAHGLVDVLSNRLELEGKNIAVVCGTGNNGGDGFCIARHLLCKGCEVSVYIYGTRDKINSKESLKNLEIIENLDVSIKEMRDIKDIPDFSRFGILIDSILGIGLKGELRGFLPQLIAEMNDTGAYKVAVDIPTGLQSDTGKISNDFFKANLTVTFHDIKPGMNEKNCGEIVIKGIGVPKNIHL